MKLLGHRTANMTLRYVQTTQQDLQREFHLARSSPRHLVPLPASVDAPDPDTIGPATVLERFSAAIRVLELYRQQNPTASGRPLQLLLRRLVRARSGFQIDRNAITKLLVLAGEKCHNLMGRLIVNIPAKDVQADEIFGTLFSFIGSLFTDARIYAFPNSGVWYDFGYLIGASLFLGGGGACST